jgi:hypothetical protein
MSLKQLSSVICICVENVTVYSPTTFHSPSTNCSLVMFVPKTGISCFIRQWILPRQIVHKTLNMPVVQVKICVLSCSYFQLCDVWSFHIVDVEVLVFLDVREEFLLRLHIHWPRRGYVPLELRDLLTPLHSLTSQQTRILYFQLVCTPEEVTDALTGFIIPIDSREYWKTNCCMGCGSTIRVTQMWQLA